MIEIIPNLLTPAMLAISPLNHAAPTFEYSWENQTAAAYDASGNLVSPDNATMRGSNSYVGQNLVVDDWNSD